VSYIVLELGLPRGMVT